MLPTEVTVMARRSGHRRRTRLSVTSTSFSRSIDRLACNPIRIDVGYPSGKPCLTYLSRVWFERLEALADIEPCYPLAGRDQ